MSTEPVEHNLAGDGWYVVVKEKGVITLRMALTAIVGLSNEGKKVQDVTTTQGLVKDTIIFDRNAALVHAGVMLGKSNGEVHIEGEGIAYVKK